LQTGEINTVNSRQWNVENQSSSSQISKAIRPIFVGGLIAGTIDASFAFYDFGWGMPRGIAGGLLGPGARNGGAATWILGLFLHFLIACSAAAIYYAASRKLTFLRDNPIVCGMFFGIAIFLVMNLVVLPLSAYHSSAPIPLAPMRKGLLIHMFFIGLPIALSVRRFSK
jgi:hypothetical protein